MFFAVPDLIAFDSEIANQPFGNGLNKHRNQK